MTESLSFTFDWRRAEHARVTALLVREQFGRGVRRAIKSVVVGVWCAGVVVAAVGVVLGDASVAWQLGPSLVVVGVLLLSFFRMTGWIHAWQVGRDDPNVAHPIVHTLDATGLHVATHSATVQLSWEGVHKVRETEDMFLTYYSPRYAYFLPKRVVGSADEAKDLRNRIRGWLPPGTAFEDGG